MDTAAADGPVSPRTRLAGADELQAAAGLLHDFNTEYGDPTPGVDQLANTLRGLLAGGDTAVLLVGEGPDGVAVLRFRAAIWSNAPECYLAELYIVPGLRGQGLGRALMEASLDFARSRGADRIELGTSGADTAARALYESLGFSNREGGPGGPLMYFYERDL